MGVFGNCLTYQCLVETFPARHDSLEDFKRTLFFATLYAKVVTLGMTHWEETNEVMSRNRRMGVSMSGLAQFLARHKSLETLRKWCEEGYKVVRESDARISARFKVPCSIKVTSIKPSGTVSLLAGATPGMHYPVSRFYLRRIRMDKDDPLVEDCRAAGYTVEVVNERTVAVGFPVDAGEGVRAQDDVSMWEQFALASFLQKYWADNQVSCTVSFDPEKEGPYLKQALQYHQYSLKGISALPRRDLSMYPHLPYETISQTQFEELSSKINQKLARRIGRDNQNDSRPELFCSNDSCTM